MRHALTLICLAFTACAGYIDTMGDCPDCDDCAECDPATCPDPLDCPDCATIYEDVPLADGCEATWAACGVSVPVAYADTGIKAPADSWVWVLRGDVWEPLSVLAVDDCAGIAADAWSPCDPPGAVIVGGVLEIDEAGDVATVAVVEGVE